MQNGSQSNDATRIACHFFLKNRQTNTVIGAKMSVSFSLEQNADNTKPSGKFCISVMVEIQLDWVDARLIN